MTLTNVALVFLTAFLLLRAQYAVLAAVDRTLAYRHNRGNR